MMPRERKGCLDVYLLGSLVGRIDYASRHNKMHFAYDANYLSRSDATPLTRSRTSQTNGCAS